MKMIDKNQKFYSGNSTNSSQFNSWYHHCQSVKLPYVIVKKTLKYATIEFESGTLPDSVNELIIYNEEMNLNKDYYSSIERIFESNSNSESSMFLSGSRVVFGKILIQESDRIANDLYDYIFNRIKHLLPL
jgi:hypothetical protein